MKFIQFLVLVLLCSPLHAQDMKLSLEQCINYALEHNFDQRSLAITQEIRQVALKQSKMERYLDLSASASQSFSNSNSSTESSWGGSYSVGTNVVIYNGGNISNTIKMNELSLTQSQTQLIQAQDNLTLSVIESYLNILMNDELLRFQREALKSSLEQVNQGRAQFAAGKIIESDFMLLESQYATDKYNETNTTINRDNSILKLKNLLSIVSSVAVDIIPLDTNQMNQLKSIPQLNDVIRRSLAWSPDMEMSRQNLKIATLNTKMTRSGFFPSISAGASVGTGYSRRGGGFGSQLDKGLNESVGLSLSVPIFSKGRVKSNVTQSQHKERQVELEAEKTELALVQRIEQDYQTVRANFAQYGAMEIKQKAYSESFRVYTEKFNAGSITVADLLIQQNTYLSAVSDLLQSKYSFILNRKVLDVYMGIKIAL